MRPWSCYALLLVIFTRPFFFIVGQVLLFMQLSLKDVMPMDVIVLKLRLCFQAYELIVVKLYNSCLWCIDVSLNMDHCMQNVFQYILFTLQLDMLVTCKVLQCHSPHISKSALSKFFYCLFKCKRNNRFFQINHG